MDIQIYKTNKLTHKLPMWLLKLFVKPTILKNCTPRNFSFQNDGVTVIPFAMSKEGK